MKSNKQFTSTAILRTLTLLMPFIFGTLGATAGGGEGGDAPREFFHTQKIVNRWVFVTPEGTPFWTQGVFLVEGNSSTDQFQESYNQRILRKYGSRERWAVQAVKRLRNWGFNTLAEYSSWYTLPTESPYGGKWSNPEKMAFNIIVRPAYYALRNKQRFIAEPVKDIIFGTSSRIYRGWRGNTLPDVFDPKFEKFTNSLMASVPKGQLDSSWLVGITVDDADNLVGFGPGPEITAERLSPHLGWLILITNPKQASNASLDATYHDTKLYSKYALRDFLETRYGSIKALNRSWRSNYTTFDSDGGWGTGKGLLDEDGSSPWIGGFDSTLNRVEPAIRGDLDSFLAEYARKYFSIAAAAVHKQAAGHLYFGPATLNAWHGLTRKQILEAAGHYVDVLQASVPTQEILDLTAKYAGDVPIVTWTGLYANPDSSLSNYVVDGGYQTQKARGEGYADAVLADFKRTVSSTGIKPIVGTKFWAFTDSWAEKRNWGLVSLKDNAYDGKEATVAAGKDSWGYPVGGEAKNYGDFISAVRRTNSQVKELLSLEILEIQKPKGKSKP